MEHVLITELFNMEGTAFSPNVSLPKIFNTVNNGGSDSTSDTVVIRLSYSSQYGNIGFEEEMLSNICKKRDDQFQSALNMRVNTNKST